MLAIFVGPSAYLIYQDLLNRELLTQPLRIDCVHQLDLTSPAPDNLCRARSMIYRHLRLLEPAITSPALQLPHTACQNHAKAWVADLFDRYGVVPFIHEMAFFIV